MLKEFRREGNKLVKTMVIDWVGEVAFQLGHETPEKCKETSIPNQESSIKIGIENSF